LKSILIVVCVIFLTVFHINAAAAVDSESRENVYQQGLNVINEFYAPASANNFETKLDEYFDFDKIISKVQHLRKKGISGDALNLELTQDLQENVFGGLYRELSKILLNADLHKVNLKTTINSDFSIKLPVAVGIAFSTASAALLAGAFGVAGSLTAPSSFWAVVSAWSAGTSLGMAGAAASIASGYGVIFIGATVIGAGGSYVYGRYAARCKLMAARNAAKREILMLRTSLEKNWLDLSLKSE